jgi:hypothetical protein
MIEIINKDRENNEDTQVQYTFINFDFMLKKIRIDLIIKRVSKELNNNFKYLEFYANKKFEQCSHLFLAKTIENSQEAD